MLTVVMKPPKTTDSLRKNPLGLYVNAIDWAREPEGAPTTRSADETQPPAPTNLPQPMIAPGSIEPLPALPAPANSAARSEEHTSELQSLMRISYAVFCLKKKKHLDLNPSNQIRYNIH